MSLRGWLLVALAYVLVLAIVALEVPTALNLRDRVNAEVRSQAAGQADVVAGERGRLARAAGPREPRRTRRHGPPMRHGHG